MPRADDDSLGDETVLWRRIIPSWIAFKDGRYRPASFAFVDRRSFEVSVFVAHLTDQDELMNPYPSDGVTGRRYNGTMPQGRHRTRGHASARSTLGCRIGLFCCDRTSDAYR